MLVSVSSFADSVSGKDSGADVFSSFFTSTDSDVSVTSLIVSVALLVSVLLVSTCSIASLKSVLVEL